MIRRFALGLACIIAFGISDWVWTQGQQPAEKKPLPPDARKPILPEEIYQTVAPSSVAFLAGRQAIGSGVLVDAERKLILTAYHVVHDNIILNRDIYVMFPEKKDGSIVTDTNYYFGSTANFEKKLKAEYVTGDMHNDLAVLRLSQLPAGVVAVPIAAKSPQPAARVHVIGCSTGSHGGIFGYNQGFVRNNYLWAYGDHFFNTIAHHSPTNHGDSGGPVVNDRGELVGIVSQGTNGTSVGWWVKQQVIDHAVSVTDITEILEQSRSGKRKYQAPGGNSITMTATASLSVDANESRGRATSLRHVDNDFIYIPAVQDDKISVSVKGSGFSDLDLSADTGRGKYFFSKTGATDQEADSHAPKYSGPFRITVSNAHTEKGRTELAERQKKLKAGEVIPAKDFQFTKQNFYNLTVSTAKPISGYIYVNRSIPANTHDEIQVSYDATKGPVRLRLIGLGRTDLDLFVFAPSEKKKENAVHSATNYLDRETIVFTPAETGIYTIRVKNRDDTWNRYCLATN